MPRKMHIPLLVKRPDSSKREGGGEREEQVWRGIGKPGRHGRGKKERGKKKRKRPNRSNYWQFHNSYEIALSAGAGAHFLGRGGGEKGRGERLRFRWA